MRNKLFLGVILTLVGGFFYSSQTAFIKAKVAILPPLPVVIFIQSVVAFLLILPFLWGKKEPILKILYSRQPGLQILRTIFSLSLSYALFYAVQHIPLMNAMLLANTAPLIIPFLAYFFLAQKINNRLWIPILIGFAGIALVLRPDGRIFDPYSLLAIASAVLMATTILAVRKLSATDSSETTSFYFFFFSIIFSGLIAIYFWVPMTLDMWIATIVVGIFYFLAQYTIVSALRFANAQLVSALLYSNIIYATLFAIVFWGSIPTWMTVLGMILIIVGGVLCIYEEYRNKIILDRGIVSYVKQTEAA